jgi:hypothetical protein
VDPLLSLGGRRAIRERADDLNRAREQVRVAFAGRPKTEAEWLIATRTLHAAEARWWQPVEATSLRIRGGDSHAIDEALDLLEEDPWCLRSGYAKELLLRRIGRRSLRPAQVARMAGIAKSWVDGPPRREFRGICRIAAQQIPELRGWSLTRLAAGEARQRLHALWLFTSFPLIDVTDAEIPLLQRSLVEFVGGDRALWRHSDWLERVARSVTSDSWQEQLLQAALDNDPPGLTELNLLARFPRLSLTPARRTRLHELILTEARRPTNSLHIAFESLAHLSGDDDLLAGAEELMRHPDPTVAMHAWWVKRQVLLAQGRYGRPP